MVQFDFAGYLSSLKDALSLLVDGEILFDERLAAAVDTLDQVRHVFVFFCEVFLLVENALFVSMELYGLSDSALDELFSSSKQLQEEVVTVR